jgi:hypothetical protein
VLLALGMAGRAAAAWSEPADCDRGDHCPVARFSDADPDAWYHDGLHACLEQGLLLGDAQGLLRPDEAVTCGMAATILYRLAGSPETSGDGDRWDAAPMGWAVDSGVLDPEDDADTALTWSRLLDLVSRYGILQGYPMEQGVEAAGLLDGGLDAFSDLDAGSTVTRAQAAELIYRFCRYAQARTEAETEPEADGSAWPLPVVLCLVGAGCAVLGAGAYLLYRRVRVDTTPMVDYHMEDDGW